MTKVRKNFDEGIQLDPSIEDGTREGEIWVDSRDNKAKIFLDGVVQEFTTSNPDNALAVSYNNITSGLDATNTQNALEELAIALQAKIDLIPIITSLEFITQPSSGNPGDNLTDIIVQVRDQFGQLYPANSDNFFLGNITLSIESGPAGATLGGTVSVSPINGVVTFTGITLDIEGDYVLKAEGINLFGFTTVEGFSSNINIELAPPAITSIELTGFPTTGTAGQPLTTFTAVIKDQYGDVYQTDGSDLGSGLMFIDYFTGPGSGPGSTPTGGTNFASPVDINGVSTFTFDDIILDPDATYTLEVAVFNSNFSIKTTVITPSIVIAEAPAITSLQVIQQPTNEFENTTISPAITVRLKDQFNNNITGTNPITATLYKAGSPVVVGTLTGTLTVSANAGNGIATFSDLNVATVDTLYVIRFSSPGLPDVDSNTFNILATPVLTSYKVIQQPTNTVGGSLISPFPSVGLYDQYNTLMVNHPSITLTATSGAIAGTGQETKDTVNGVATFNNLLAVNFAGNYSITFSDISLSVVSNNFNITLPASKFVITQQPTSALEGSAMTPSFIVQAWSSDDLLVSSYSGTVSVSITSNPSGGTLSGTTSIALSNGQATFSDLSIDNPGANYFLTFSDGSLTNAVTSGVEIIQRVATSLDIIQQPSNTIPDTIISPAITVQIKDQGNNNITGTNTITATLSSGSFSSGTTTVNAVNGLATFSDLQVSTTGSYTVTFSSTGLISDTSNNFNIELDYNNLTWTETLQSTLGGSEALTTTTPTSITIDNYPADFNVFSEAYINQYISSGNFRIQFRLLTESGIHPSSGPTTTGGIVRLLNATGNLASDTISLSFQPNFNNGRIALTGPVSSSNPSWTFWTRSVTDETFSNNDVHRIDITNNECKYYKNNVLKLEAIRNGSPVAVDYPFNVQFRPDGWGEINIVSTFTDITITPLP